MEWNLVIGNDDAIGDTLTPPGGGVATWFEAWDRK